MLHNFRRMVCLLLAAALLAGMPALAASLEVTVNTSTRFYRSASTSSASVSLPKGTELTMTGASGGWARVKYRGVTGYVPSKYLNSEVRKGAYVNRSTYIYASASTSSSRKAVSVNTKVYVVGKSGSFYRVENSSGSATGYIPTGHLSSGRVSTASGSAKRSGSWKSRVVKLNWFNGGSSVLPVGSYGYIYDIDTGVVVHIKRMGGTNHADCEPSSRSDTAKLLKIAGGSFSWDSHAVILYANGKFVACGINTKPHGDQTLTGNGYNGQFCLHMAGSKTHGSDTYNTDHQSSVVRAYNWAH